MAAFADLTAFEPVAVDLDPLRAVRRPKNSALPTAHTAAGEGCILSCHASLCLNRCTLLRCCLLLPLPKVSCTVSLKTEPPSFLIFSGFQCRLELNHQAQDIVNLCAWPGVCAGPSCLLAIERSVVHGRRAYYMKQLTSFSSTRRSAYEQWSLVRNIPPMLLDPKRRHHTAEVRQRGLHAAPPRASLGHRKKLQYAEQPLALRSQNS